MRHLSSSVTIALDARLALKLTDAAERNGLEAEEIIRRCLRDHLDEVGSYARVDDELASIDEDLVTLASLIGEALVLLNHEPAREVRLRSILILSMIPGSAG